MELEKLKQMTNQQLTDIYMMYSYGHDLEMVYTREEIAYILSRIVKRPIPPVTEEDISED
jgi:hypothetical protein